jgi:ribonuclease HII
MDDKWYKEISNNEAEEIEHTLLQLANEKLNKKTTRKTKTKSGSSSNHETLTPNVIKRSDEEKKTKTRAKKDPLKLCYHENIPIGVDTYKDTDTPEKERILEAGIDEAGRGPLFGRVYAACVILPSDHTKFDHTKVKDSKRFSSKKKLLEVYEYIKQNAVDYAVWYEDEKTIDEINIRQATQKCMNKSIESLKVKPSFLLIDGCDFITQMEEEIPFICIEGGDNMYASIAAASILAKVERDTYIEELCSAFPYLEEKYGICSNKGYGTKKHLDGIREYGITEWHRKTFGICKTCSM